MYLLEWLHWHVNTLSKEKKAEMMEGNKNLKPIPSYQQTLEADTREKPKWRMPRSRGPVYAINDTYLEMRCGAMEEWRGLGTVITLSIFAVIFIFCDFLFICLWSTLTDSMIYADDPVYARLPAWEDYVSAIITFILGCFCSWVYFKYLFRFSRLEMFTWRHLVVRFNRKTRQVYLLRPKSCGGTVVLPWDGVYCDVQRNPTPKDTELSGVGMFVTLFWHPHFTGLPYSEMALVGKKAGGYSELKAEWEFIRRYMEEGLSSVPRPALTSHWPSPIQAFGVQLEGARGLLKGLEGIWLLLALLVSPVFIILACCHWISLLLCVKPRWPKEIEEAGQEGKPVPAFTKVSDYPQAQQALLEVNREEWQVLPGWAPEEETEEKRQEAYRLRMNKQKGALRKR